MNDLITTSVVASHSMVQGRGVVAVATEIIKIEPDATGRTVIIEDAISYTCCLSKP